MTAFTACSCIQISLEPAEHTHLIQENQEDSQWSDEFQDEHENPESVKTERSVVGDFLPHNLAVEIPSGEQYGEQTAQRQHPFGGEIVKQVEQRHAADGIRRADTQGQRTENTQEQADARNQIGSFLA